MESVGFPLKSACILIFLILENFCVTCDNHWCYDLPSCGPDTWGSIGSCDGFKQSPVNIDTTSATPKSFEPLYFKHYEDCLLAKKVKNTGYQYQMDFHPKATISGAGLLATYTLQKMHFHWGTNESNGAEHTINGKRYAMELHLVHTKNNMTIEEASKLSDGLAVLAFFLEVTKGPEQQDSWMTVAKLSKNVPEKGNSYDLKGEFSVGGLLSKADTDHYFVYSGSLTTPPCTEAVIWIVIEDPIRISFTVANILSNSLYFTTIQENRRMQNNFRPIQALNSRKIYYYTEHPRQSLAGCMRLCVARFF